MSSETLAFALAAGTLAAVNPCAFAVLPAYLSLFVVGADQGSQPLAWRAIGRALTATASMTLGFVAVFGVFGLVLTPVATSVQRWLPVATVVIGALLIGFGVVLLVGRTVAPRVPFLRLSKDPVASPIATMLYGVSYGVASLGCTVGPFLVVTATTFRAGDFTSGVAAYGAYAAGMGLVGCPCGRGCAHGADGSGSATPGHALLTRLSGALLVLVGAYVGWYGWYELRLYAGGSAADPVVSAAAQIQSRLAQLVDGIGPAAFATILVILLGMVIGARVLLVRRRGRAPERPRAERPG